MTGLSDEYLGSATGETVLHQPHDGLCDLLPTLRRGLDKIGVVSFLRAHETQVEQGHAVGERCADDAIVEYRQPHERDSLQGRVGKARVVDSADRRR